MQQADNFQLTMTERKTILSKFPSNLKPFLSSIENPLDETQILVHLFKDKNVRIILREEFDEEGDLEYVAYFCAIDLARNINYDARHITQWKSRWNSNLLDYKSLVKSVVINKVSQIERLGRTIQNFESIPRKDAQFLSESDLKKVLIKINTPEAKKFQEWILSQSRVTKKVIRWALRIQSDRNIKSQDEDLNKLKKSLSCNKQYMIKKSLEAVKKYPEPKRLSGYIYISSSPKQEKEKIFKIGLTTKLNGRYSCLTTSNPDKNLNYCLDFYIALLSDMKYLYSKQCQDINLAETFIHKFCSNLHYSKEFYYFSSLTRASQIIDRVCQFVDDMVAAYNDENTLLQTDFLDEELPKENSEEQIFKKQKKQNKYMIEDDIESIQLVESDNESEEICPEVFSEESEPKSVTQTESEEAVSEMINEEQVEKERIPGRCVDCDASITKKHQRCIRCAAIKSKYQYSKVPNRPDKAELIKVLRNSNFVLVGRKYGVSDNCVRKWLRQYNVDPKTLKDIDTNGKKDKTN